ncbi:hypothetical protein ACWDV4_19535 [Micromonospora sp. NPDC003197]
MGITTDTEAAIARWHEIVNTGDLTRVQEIVADPIVVNGPKGAGPINPDEFAKWIERSGITLRPTSFHPISDRVLVVEQDARWPEDTAPTRVATMFRTTDGVVSAALRFPALRPALEFAYLYRELAATEARA